MMGDIPSSEEATEALDDIKNKADELSSIIEDFQTYPNELKKIITNIIQNSKEAIERENISNGKISIQTYNEDSTRATIKIIDNGGGIKSDMDKIFNPYFSTKDKQHGVGLGLYMCKLIIELHLS